MLAATICTASQTPQCSSRRLIQVKYSEPSSFTVPQRIGGQEPSAGRLVVAGTEVIEPRRIDSAAPPSRRRRQLGDVRKRGRLRARQWPVGPHPRREPRCNSAGDRRHPVAELVIDDALRSAARIHNRSLKSARPLEAAVAAIQIGSVDFPGYGAYSKRLLHRPRYW